MAKNKKYQVTFDIETDDDISYIDLDVINSITSEILDARVKDVIEIQ